MLIIQDSLNMFLIAIKFKKWAIGFANKIKDCQFYYLIHLILIEGTVQVNQFFCKNKEQLLKTILMLLWIMFGMDFILDRKDYKGSPVLYGLLTKVYMMSFIQDLPQKINVSNLFRKIPLLLWLLGLLIQKHLLIK